MGAIRLYSLCFAVLLAAVLHIATSDEAPDALSVGPYTASFGEYRYEERVHPEVLADRVTDLAGRIYYPMEISTLEPLPIVVIIPGNTATCALYVRDNTTYLPLVCDYSMTGVCPPGFDVVQSYRGYGYLGEHLASWGFVVVSVDANRGISCSPGIAGDESLNLARGRQVLYTLQQLYQWNEGFAQTPKTVGVDLRRRLDLSQVGLVGHSRGGEGVRAAVAQYVRPRSIWRDRVPGLQVLGIFELAGSDGQSRGTYDAEGIAWVGLVSGCDGDDIEVKDIHPYDRMLQYTWEDRRVFKAVYVVNGANHNYLNTEWKLTDTIKCLGAHEKIWESTDEASTAMRTVVKNAFTAFFRTVMGELRDPSLERNFNPLYNVPAAISDITVVTRSYAQSLAREDVLEVEGFTGPTGFSQQGEAEDMGVGVSTNHSRIFNSAHQYRHDEIFTSSLVQWESGGHYADFWSPDGQGVDIGAFNTLSFRVAQADNDELNVLDHTDFDVSLVDSSSKVVGKKAQLSDWAYVEGPIGPLSLYIPRITANNGLNPVLQTVLIPLGYFELPQSVVDGGGSGRGVRGIRFDFPADTTGAIWLASIRFQNVTDLPTGTPAPRFTETLLRPLKKDVTWR